MLYTIIINIGSYILADFINSVLKRKKEDYYKIKHESIEFDNID